MPKLRAVRTKEEAELVPPNETIEVVLTDPAPPADEIETVETKPAKEKKVEAKQPPKTEEAEPPVENDATKALREQLQKSQDAERIAREQLTAAQQREQNLQRERDESREQMVRHQKQSEEARYTAIVNALAAVQAEAESAQQAWEAADLAGDSKARAEAQRRLSRAEANVARYEDAKETFEAERETKAKQPPRQEQPQRQSDPIENAIASLPSEAQKWLRAHPEYITDTRKNAKISALHWDVLDEGHQQFTPAYFESLEMHLGLRERPKVEQEEEEEEAAPPPPPPRSRAVPAAPPTRDVPSPSGARTSSTKVQLTEDERATARFSMPHLSPGEAEIEYARQKTKLNALKAQGHYQERG